MRNCWCGSSKYSLFSTEYGKCHDCGTLIAVRGMTAEQLDVHNDDTDFYGKQYWIEHQENDLGLPDIHARARNDLTERNLHWLRTLLKYRLPPAKILELGCAHGSFVALLHHAGYDSSGVEMSPWVVEFGRKTFGVPIFVGPVETLDIPFASLDVIALMDVLEHLPDPAATMSHCLKLLKPEGLLLIQTPQFKEDMNFKKLVEEKSPFLEQFKADEHLYLFSKQAVARLFLRLGAEHIQFEKAIFSDYDMYFAVSRVPLQAMAAEQIEAAMLSTANRRMTLALLDLRKREEDSNADRVVRGEQIQTLSELLKESEADRVERAGQIDSLTALLKVSETGRAEQAKQIECLSSNVRSLLGRPSFRVLKGVLNYRELTSLEQLLAHQHKLLKAIAVDLTPVLPSGANGGAKIFVIELLNHLAEMAPQTQFVLLTQAASHEELSALDRPNVSRKMVIGPSVEPSVTQRKRGLASRVFHQLPGWSQGVLRRIGARLKLMPKQDGLPGLLRDNGIDLLFCPFTAPTYAEPGIPTVCTIYDLQYKTYPEFFSAEDVEHRNQVFIDACRRATALTAISDYSRDSAIDHGKIDRDRIRTIHLRIAHRVSPRSDHDTSVLNRLGISARQYLIYPANFWKHKNHEMLLTAFGMACHSGLPDYIKLVCTGEPGPHQEWLTRAARTMNLGDRLVFPGYLPDAELAALMNNSIGVVFPSLYEGFGLPVIEAMAAGIPVACSNTTSLPEVAADAAVLFDPRIPTQIAQAMVSLVEDAALRSRLIRSGIQRAADFSDTKRMAREYWELFQHAFTNQQREDHMTGTYPDGWAGPMLSVQVAPAAGMQTLELEFFAPAWLPQSKLTVHASRGGVPQGKRVDLARGENAVLTLSVDTAGGCYDIRVAPTFVPERAGLGNDQRELSAIVKRCSIDRGNAACIELFSEMIST